MDKVIYSLGCACYPHLLSRQRYPHLTSPSLFAGHAYIQQLYTRFVPTILFTEEIEDVFFGIDKWDVIQRDSSRDYFMNTRTGKMFYYNHSSKEYHDIVCCDFKPKDELIYMNKFVPIINFHPLEKTPGINPIYEDYQRKKYQFWKEHRFEQYYLVELNSFITKEMIDEFMNVVVKNGYDENRFIVFYQYEDYSKVGEKQYSLLKDLI